jgi:hypothetical protein
MALTVLLPGSGRPHVDGDALDQTAPLVFTVDRVLSADECAALIERIDALGPTVAPISTPRGFVMNEDVRNNTRVIFDDVALAQILFERIEAHVPAQLCGMRPVGANERFRCYRYERAQQFATHRDGSFVRSDDEMSLLTFMVYLNEGFGGGQTRFHDVSVTPQTGLALLFQHFLLHEGSSVTSGVKYVLRSDVMYRR